MKEFFSVNKKRDSEGNSALQREWENYVFLMDEVGGKEVERDLYVFLLGRIKTHHCNMQTKLKLFVFDVWMQISPWENGTIDRRNVSYIKYYSLNRILLHVKEVFLYL